MKNYIAPELEIDAVETKDVVTESWYGKVVTTTETEKVVDPVTGEETIVENKIANVTVGVGGLVNRGV